MTFTSLDGQPVKYWLANENGLNYLTKDEEFGDFRIVSNQKDPMAVSIGHWGDDSFDLNGLNLEGKVFAPFKLHPWSFGKTNNPARQRQANSISLKRIETDKPPRSRHGRRNGAAPRLEPSSEGSLTPHTIKLTKLPDGSLFNSMVVQVVHLAILCPCLTGNLQGINTFNTYFSCTELLFNNALSR